MFSFQELGILDNPNYKICFLLDSGAMITVLSSKYGLIEVGCDSLHVIVCTSVSTQVKPTSSICYSWHQV